MRARVIVLFVTATLIAACGPASVDPETATRLSGELVEIIRTTGDAAAAGELIDDGADLNVEAEYELDLFGQQKSWRLTPLMVAAIAGDYEITELLLKNEADPDLVYEDGTALFLATRGNKDSIVELLLDYGADPSVAGQGETPLEYATRSEDVAMVTTLLAGGANPDMWSSVPPLWAAARAANREIALALLAAGADPDASAEEDDGPPLFDAVRELDLTLVQALLDAGADPNATTPRRTIWEFFQYTPPDARAAAREIADSLLDAGADPNRTFVTDEGVTLSTPLATVISDLWRGSDPQLASLLISAGARLRQDEIEELQLTDSAEIEYFVSENLMTATEIALLVQEPLGSASSQLIDAIADIAAGGDADAAAVEAILMDGADLAMRDADGLTALQYALVNHFGKTAMTRVVDLLLQYGASADEAYRWSVERRNEDLIPIALAAGADPDAGGDVWVLAFNAYGQGPPEPAYLQMLVDSGAGVDARETNSGRTLMQVCMNVWGDPAYEGREWEICPASAIPVFIGAGAELPPEGVPTEALRRLPSEISAQLASYAGANSVAPERSGQIDALLGGDISEIGLLLSDDQLFGFTRAELRIVRNSFFAYHGHQFRSEDLQSHFGQFDWYAPSGDATALLTDNDRANVALVRIAEDSLADKPANTRYGD